MKILVPVDFRRTSFTAYCYANTLAARLHAEITLLFVIKEKSDFDQHLEHQLLAFMKMHSAGLLEDFAANYPKQQGIALQDVPLDYDVQFGIPGKKIIEIAKENDFDLIVMGIRDKLNFMTRISGTTATSVMNHANIPTIMVHADSPHDLPKKIAFAIDKKKDLDKGIKAFKRLNNDIKASTEFIHISPNHDKTILDLKKELVSDLFDDSDPKFSVMVKHLQSDNVLQKLYDYCLLENIDLLTMIHKKDGIIDLLLNQSKTIKTAYNFHIPLLVLPN